MVADALIVRAYEAADAESVTALWREIFAADPPWNEPGLVIRRKLAVQPELFLVGELGGAVIATVLAGFDGVRGWIHHLAVVPAHRRRGFGRLMMAEAERRLRRLGCPKVNLQVRASNAAVVEFYRRLDYQIEERVSFGKRLE